MTDIHFRVVVEKDETGGERGRIRTWREIQRFG